MPEEKFYHLVGLQPSEYMPIQFDGREYNLAHLTDEEARYLLQYPEQVPHLKPNSVSQAD